ncbi:MAG TPA: hypothetical protein VNI20_13640, partial [Fimbriimonadaceae bacterium]|nr:hypothetical protein [Fimbriimonadaceae bacterium]
FKRIEARFHGSIGKRIGLYAGAVLGAAIVQKILSLGLSAIPKLAETTYEVSRLRMVIFAGTLIIVMLLRPQGVLAHHEFSWTWLKKVLTRLLNVFKRKEAVA